VHIRILVHLTGFNAIVHMCTVFYLHSTKHAQNYLTGLPELASNRWKAQEWYESNLLRLIQ